jgi:hypothetical protein
MRIKYFFILLLVPVLSLGCLVSAPAGGAGSAAGTKYDATQDSRITTLEGIILGPNGLQTLVSALNTKITSISDSSGLSSRVSSLETRMGSVESKTSSVPASEKEDIAALSARIKTLEDWKAGLGTVTPGTTTVPTSSTGAVSITTNPVSIPQMYSASTGSGTNIFYTIHITNSSTTWQYVKPIVTMTIASSYSSRAVTGITVTMSNGQCNITGSIIPPTVATSNVGNFSISPNVGVGATTTASLTIIPITGCNGTGEFQIGAGQVMDVLVQISGVTSSDVTLWNVSNSISTRSM